MSTLNSQTPTGLSSQLLPLLQGRVMGPLINLTAQVQDRGAAKAYHLTRQKQSKYEALYIRIMPSQG